MEKYGKIQGIDKPVSRLVYGCAGIERRKEDPMRLLDAAFAAGCNAFDTARVYGEADRILGEWIASRGIRDKVVILAKGGHPVLAPDEKGGLSVVRRRITREDIRRDVDESLRALQVERLDGFLLHRDDPSVPVGEVSEWMDELVKEGKVGAIGGSNWTARRIFEQQAYAVQHGFARFTLSSPHFSLARREADIFGDRCVTLTGGDAASEREWYRQNPVSVLAYGALSEGFFSGKWHSGDFHRREALMDPMSLAGYGSGENFARLGRTETMAVRRGCTPSQLALRWLFTRGMDLFAAFSSGSPDRIRENWRALDLELPQAEADRLCSE